jgi:hypothetical protein
MAAVGVTWLDRADSVPVPTAFTAATVNEYAVPLVRLRTRALAVEAPGTSTVDDGVVASPRKTEIRWPVTGEPPVSVPGVQVSVAELSAAVAVPIPGARGAVAGVTLVDGADSGPGPCALIATTENV